VGRLPLWLFGAWLFALTVNGARIVVTVWTRAVAEVVLPASCFPAVHLASGVLVFFPALLAMWWLCVRHALCEDVPHE
jgi:hypothetical protein